MMIEAAARRNYKKAVRNGYEFARIEFNDYLEDVGAIWRSAPVRQGRMPDHLLTGTPRPCSNPPSRSRVHDYPHFGVLKDGTLVAYAGNLGRESILLQGKQSQPVIAAVILF